LVALRIHARSVGGSMPNGKEAGVLRSEFGTQGGEQRCRATRGSVAMLPTELLA